MEVRCKSCSRASTISEPADESWEFVQGEMGEESFHQIVWKCSQNLNTPEEPKLCGATNVIIKEETSA